LFRSRCFSTPSVRSRRYVHTNCPRFRDTLNPRDINRKRRALGHSPNPYETLTYPSPEPNSFRNHSFRARHPDVRVYPAGTPPRTLNGAYDSYEYNNGSPDVAKFRRGRTRRRSDETRPGPPACRRFAILATCNRGRGEIRRYIYIYRNFGAPSDTETRQSPRPIKIVVAICLSLKHFPRPFASRPKRARRYRGVLAPSRRYSFRAVLGTPTSERRQFGSTNVQLKNGTKFIARTVRFDGSRRGFVRLRLYSVRSVAETIFRNSYTPTESFSRKRNIYTVSSMSRKYVYNLIVIFLAI